MLWRLFIAALWPPARNGLTSWLSFVMFNCVLVTFPFGVQGQVWFLIVSIPDLCHISYGCRDIQSQKRTGECERDRNLKLSFKQM